MKVIEYNDIIKGGISDAMTKLTDQVPFEVESYFSSVAAHTDKI